MFRKFGENLELTADNIKSQDSVLALISDAAINEQFKKFANELKRIAPKADDFLYFSAVIMHAAEASAIDSEGKTKLTRNGEKLNVGWDKKGDSWKWFSNDSTVFPYKNSNGDIFPEIELIAAHRKWVGKPLCVDHKSDSVDAIRGVILDTYYDQMHKRVIALCALDKVSYPELARKVATGYSTSVSMGTGVSVAICFDCGKAARVEADFCHHMRNRTCYGEINTGLNPIELSIVVNGADPKAKIRTILAAAQEINQNIQTKEEEFGMAKNSSSLDEYKEKLQDINDDLQKLNSKITDLQASLDTGDETQPAYGMTGFKEQMDNPLPNTDFSLNLPQRNVEGKNNTALLLEIKASLRGMEDYLTQFSTKIKEELMSDNMNKKGYFQGGGGVNEPTPGKPKYPKDPMNEDLREKADKQMVGQKPFPDVGDVEGLHPSPESAEQKDELERKKMLARAESEQRSIRRAAALQKAKENLMEQKKQAYFQGGGGVNEPEPHKVKYPKDPLNEHLREKEDKQMVGQKPFPDVGAVDGLHPSPQSADEKDELKRKEHLRRAALKARFVKAAAADGSEDLGKSSWQVFVDDKLAMTASVDEITGGNADILYDSVATKEFGTKLVSSIRDLGIAKTASLFKKSQAVTGMGAEPAAPADMGGAAPVPPTAGDMAEPLPAPGAEEPKMEGAGDLKDTVMELAEKVKDGVSEVNTNVSDLDEALKALVGEQSEMGDVEELGKAASLGTLHTMRKEINEALVDSFKKASDELKEHEEELKLIAGILEDGSVDDSNKEYVTSIVEDAISDAKTAVADSFKLMGAFVKYAKGTESLLKKQAEIEELDASDGSSTSADSAKASDGSSTSEDSAKASDGSSASDSCKADDVNDHFGEGESTGMPAGLYHAKSSGDSADKASDAMCAADSECASDLNDVKLEVDLPDADMGKMFEKAKVVASEKPNLSTKEGRAEYRAKLAAESVEFSKMLDEAHPQGGTQTALDVKPSDELGKVEDKIERHKKMLEVAEMPPKVRKEAARIQELVKAGKLAAEDVDNLVAHGVDPEAVKYWKEMWGEAGKEGSEFATELVKEHAKAELEKEVATHKVKLARAYEVAYDMVRRGLLAEDNSAITAQVNEIMKWNDEAFDSMKRVIAKHAPLSLSKKAMPQVGIMDSAPEQLTKEAQSDDLASALEQHFSSRRF